MDTKIPELNRHIGLVALIAYGVGDILGAGIYGLVGKAAGQAGHALWLIFLASMIAAGLTGLSYASLGSRYPRAAGASYITFRAFGSRFLSWCVGLAVMASGLTSMAAASRVFAGYLAGTLPGVPPTVIATGFALLLATIVFRGIRESMVANGICTSIELAGLLIVIAVGLSWVGGVDYLDATTPANLSGDITLTFVLGGAVLTFYSFVGFEDMLNVSEEVRNPRRNIPIALLTALGIACTIYMLVCIVAVSVVPPDELATSTQPLVDVVHKAAPAFPTGLFSVIALFAVANTALLNFVMGSRLAYGMAVQGLLPRALAAVHPTRHTPHLAIIAVLSVFIALILSGDISVLARSTSVLLLGCFLIVNLSLLVLQRREHIPGSFEVPSLIPLAGAIICLAMLSQAGWAELKVAGTLLAGIILLFWLVKPQALPGDPAAPPAQ
jgi:APA family basic amino acid/polyamine antiporter